MEFLNSIISILSLVIAVVSIFIARSANQIARRALVLTSREYAPRLEINITEDGVLEIRNNDEDIFTIIQIGFLKVDYWGFEDSLKKEFIKFPLVTQSRLRNDFGKDNPIVLSEKNAYMIFCLPAMSSTEISRIRERVTNCQRENSNWYPIPSLRSVTHYIEVIYANDFHEQKTMLVKNKHYHGAGYQKTSISEETFQKEIKFLTIPDDLAGEELWAYMVERYKTKLQ